MALCSKCLKEAETVSLQGGKTESKKTADRCSRCGRKL
jgi:DNA-directed RNA polymerase subunit RPC12/RpoP